MNPVEASELLAFLRDPLGGLLMYGKVQEQEEEEIVPYDPYRLTHKLQATILHYAHEPPKTEDGHNKWLVAVAARQSGKSVTAEYAMFPRAMYTPGWDHACMADTDPRAQYLHGRIQRLYTEWPTELRPPKLAKNSSLHLQVDRKIGGQMRTMSARSGYAGIGMSLSSFHASEIPFWQDADGRTAANVFSFLLPAMRNRKSAMMIMEATPAPLSAPSSLYFRDLAKEARKGEGRFIYTFEPFWDNKLCVRTWKPEWRLDSEEEFLLQKYGADGMALEHLAFRRSVLDEDEEIKKNPELFKIYYPMDDISCWVQAGGGSIPTKYIDKLLARLLFPWNGPYTEYEAPVEGAIYVIGADPAGWGVRDHASFQVLKIYNEEVTQVATFSSAVVDPISFTRALINAGIRYNNALIVVEANGVGAGPLALLIASKYPRLYYADPTGGKPGKAMSESAHADMMTQLLDDIDSGRLILRDADTVDQLSTYRSDAILQASTRVEIIGSGIGRGRRDRHHWDKVSALLLALYGSRFVARRFKPVDRPQAVQQVTQGKDLSQMTAAEYEKYLKEIAPKPAKGRGFFYYRGRR